MGAVSKRGPAGFDLIAFSNAVVLELVNVVVMLQKSGVPLSKAARMENEAVPLVIMGGSNAFAASAFSVPDPPLDAIFAGESVECIEEIFRLCAEGKKSGLRKRELLKLLANVPGFLEPDMPRSTRRAVEATLSLNALLEDAPVPASGGNQGTGNLQVSEGCACFCSFCSESFCRKPFREAPASDVVKSALKMKACMGLDKVEIYSFNFNMYSQLEAVCAQLAGAGLSIGLKSQRFDVLPHDPALLQLMQAVGKTSLTFGLEGISARLRRYLHKSLSDADIRASISLLASAPMRELKIFLIVTGLETLEDFGEFETLLRHVKDNTTLAGRGLRVIFSATPLVRFPWTPLEFEDAPLPETLIPLCDSLARFVQNAGFEFRLACDLNHYFMSQVLVRASDARVYHGLVAAAADTGFVYYRSVPFSFTNAFARRCSSAGLSRETMLKGHSHSDAAKPWLHVGTGVSREFLFRQHDAARTYADNGFCLGSYSGEGACLACGACDDTPRSGLIARRWRHKLSGPLFSPRVNTEKVSFLIDASDRSRGLPRAIVGAALARAIMRAVPETVSSYAGYGGTFWSQGDNPCWMVGRDVATLLWSATGVERVKAALSDESLLSKINTAFVSWGRVVSVCKTEPVWWSLLLRSSHPFDPKGYCAEKGLSYTLKKTGALAYSFGFSPKAAKKKLIRSLSYKMSDIGETEIVLAISSKFDVEEFVKKVFICADENEWVTVRVEVREDGIAFENSAAALLPVRAQELPDSLHGDR